MSTRVPALADTAGLAGLSDRELLLAVLDKLNSLEARLDKESAVARARFDSVLRAAGGATLATLPADAKRLAIAAAPTRQGSVQFGLEGSLCVQQEWAADAKIESSLSLWGGAEGMLGVDAYGNGATGDVQGFATADTRVIPGGGAKLTLEICGKVNPSVAYSAAPQTGVTATALAPSSAPSAAESLLQNALTSVSLDQVAAGAQRLGMDGSRLGQAVNALGSFSLADLPFGRGASGSLLNALPMPADVANLLQNPLNVLQKASEASQFAINTVCNQSLFTGDFAQRALEACNLRGQAPTGAGLFSLLQGLNGLSGTLGTLKSDVASACSLIDAMLPVKVSVPPVDVTFPLGIGTVRTFPGYSQSLFPGLGSGC